MVLFKFIPILLMLQVFWNSSSAAEKMTTLRRKRSLTTICVEIKPSGPLEEPYYMCKGTELPRLGPKPPSYTPSSANYQKQNPSYSSQYQDTAMESYGKQPVNSRANDGSGYTGFRRPAAASYHSPTPTDQQYFRNPSQFQPQQKYEYQQQQQQKQFKNAPSSQFAPGYGFSTGKQQPASYAPSNSEYGTSGPSTQAQALYGKTSGGGGSSSDSRTFLRPQTNTASYGGGTNQVQTTTSGGTHGAPAKSSFASSLPHASTSKTSYDSSLPYANAPAAPTDVEEHSYAQETPPTTFMVPTANQSPAVNIKSSPSAYATDGGTEREQTARTHDNNPNTPAFYQPKTAKTLSPELNDYRSLFGEDIMQSPVWGFSPDEFASFRSISDEEEEQPHSISERIPDPRQEAERREADRQVIDRQAAERFMQHMPPEYRDDPVMRAFYRSLHEPIDAADPLLPRSNYNTNTAPKTTPARPEMPNQAQPAQYPPARRTPNLPQPFQNYYGSPQPAVPRPVAPQSMTPQPVAPQPVAPQPVAPQPVASQPVAPQQPVAPPQRMLPQAQKGAVINTATLCATGPPPRQYLQECAPDSQRRLIPFPICEPCDRRDYSYQPVFIALPCPPGNGAYSNPGASQTDYSNAMNQYMASFQNFPMTYATTNLGSAHAYPVYSNNQQYPVSNRASSSEDNLNKQTTNGAAKNTATSNEQGSGLSSQESSESASLSGAKSNEATDGKVISSLEAAETKATRPLEETTISLADFTVETTTAPDLGSRERVAGTDLRTEDLSSLEDIPMGTETRKTFDTIFNLAKDFTDLHYEQEGKGTPYNPAYEEELRKGMRKRKRQNAAQQSSGLYKTPIEHVY